MAKQDKGSKTKKVTGKASYAFLKDLINTPSHRFRMERAEIMAQLHQSVDR